MAKYKTVSSLRIDRWNPNLLVIWVGGFCWLSILFPSFVFSLLSLSFLSISFIF